MSDKLTLLEKLNKIQTELAAPKGQRNDFGKYNYRSCEDICNAVKPLLKELGCVQLLSDELELIGDRYYIRAKATIKDNSGVIYVIAYARESEIKKGMDSAQITGASSSYARKYALNGLYSIDDSKTDPDMLKPEDNTSVKKTVNKKPASGEKTWMTQELFDKLIKLTDYDKLCDNIKGYSKGKYGMNKIYKEALNKRADELHKTA